MMMTTISNIRRDEFKTRNGHYAKAQTRIGDHVNGWCLMAGVDRRGYSVFLERDAPDKPIVVTAGCRSYTLRAALNHWRKNAGDRYRNSMNRDMLVLIELGLKRANMNGWLKHYPKWWTTKLRKR
jgi:hypothetical protein